MFTENVPSKLLNTLSWCQILVLAYSAQLGICAETSPSLNSLNYTSGGCDGDVELLTLLKGRLPNELPEIKSSSIDDDAGFSRASEYMFNKPDDLNRRYKISDTIVMQFVAVAYESIYSWIFAHQYDSHNDMRLAAGASVDNEQCIGQLENLVARAELLAEEKFNSTDINFYRLMDTWGGTSSGQLLGNLFTEGNYNECGRLKIELPGGRQALTRYCSLSTRLKSWPNIDKHNLLGLRVGICIPKACDSSMSRNKVDLIMRLLEYQMRQLDRGQFLANKLYCLPDDDSPLRSILVSPKATATLILLSGWLVLLLYCTYMHHKLGDSMAPNIDPKNLMNRISASAGQQQSAHGKMCSMLSIMENLIELFSINELEKNNKESVRQEVRETEIVDVDFRCIDGIKVISMIHIIMAHVLMCLMTLTANLREMTGRTSLAFYLANLLPALAVNSFFTITGTLTCYTKLKQDQSYKFITSPTAWISFFVHRYLRIMPVYAAVVLYCKTLAKYTSSGPLWDYATSSLSQRRTCEQEPWSTTLLFTANYPKPLTLCVPGGWYLANDFQFHLITPFFLALLQRGPIIGQALLCLCTVASFLGGTWSMFNTNLSDPRAIFSLEPQAFKMHASHFNIAYTRPQYRIHAYLIGLLVGYRLYLFERARVEFRVQTKAWLLQQQRKAEAQLRGTAQVALPQPREPDWCWHLKKFAIPFSLNSIALCMALPLICFGLQYSFNNSTNHFLLAFLVPLTYVLFALAIGSYLLIATTRSGTILSNFLAASCWKPLARLSLCALLVNIEVINYIIQGSTSMHNMSSQLHFVLNCVCILATYLVSIVVYVLFEAPLRAALSLLLTYAIKRSSTRIKRQKAVKTC